MTFNQEHEKSPVLLPSFCDFRRIYPTDPSLKILVVQAKKHKSPDSFVRTLHS